MVSKRVNVDIDVRLSPEELALVFWNMSDRGQAEFFNALGKIDRCLLRKQLANIGSYNGLDEDGKAAMMLIGEYCQWP